MLKTKKVFEALKCLSSEFSGAHGWDLAIEITDDGKVYYGFGTQYYNCVANKNDVVGWHGGQVINQTIFGWIHDKSDNCLRKTANEIVTYYNETFKK